jgi:hypothetical protein
MPGRLVFDLSLNLPSLIPPDSVQHLLFRSPSIRSSTLTDNDLQYLNNQNFAGPILREMHETLA